MLLAGFVLVIIIIGIQRLIPSVHSNIDSKVGVYLAESCNRQEYEDIALNSLRHTDTSYAHITKQDLTDTNLLKDYLGKVKEMCSAFANNIGLSKTKINDTTWSYRFSFSNEFVNLVEYEVHYFDNQWRFVLPESAYL